MKAQDEWLEQQLAGLAESLDVGGDQADALGWGSTGSVLRQAASSIRWQLRWSEPHPARRDGP